MPADTDGDVLGTGTASGDITEATRREVSRLLAARDAGDVDAVAALLAEQVVLRPPASEGALAVVGRHDVARRLLDGQASSRLRADTVRHTVHRMIVDGDTAVVLQNVRALTQVGLEYVNEFALVCRVRGGLVDRVQCHADTLSAARVGILPFYWL
jgi:ketosteroid isomerase-like protein